MAFQGGYHKLVCAKCDIKVPGHNQVIPYKHTQADLAGRRQGVGGVDFPVGSHSSDMQAIKSGTAY